ncbi:head GIN domain-containing protein [Chloroflexota bacterium]
MKKFSVLAFVIILLLSGIPTGCLGAKVEGSGRLIEKSFDFSDFTDIQVQNGFKVELVKSDAFNVEVTVDDNVLEHIEVTESGGTLRIRAKTNRQFRSATLEARVTMPEVHNLELSGGSRTSIGGFESLHDLDIKLSGGSHVSASGDISMGDIDFNLSGGSHVTLSGEAKDIKIDGSGGSHINLDNLNANNADINLSGGSHATIDARGTLNVDINGGSRVTYTGNPKKGDIDVAWDSDLVEK